MSYFQHRGNVVLGRLWTKSPSLELFESSLEESWTVVFGAFWLQFGFDFLLLALIGLGFFWVFLFVIFVVVFCVWFGFVEGFFFFHQKLNLNFFLI